MGVRLGSNKCGGSLAGPGTGATPVSIGFRAQTGPIPQTDSRRTCAGPGWSRSLPETRQVARRSFGSEADAPGMPERPLQREPSTGGSLTYWPVVCAGRSGRLAYKCRRAGLTVLTVSGKIAGTPWCPPGLPGLPGWAHRAGRAEIFQCHTWVHLQPIGARVGPIIRNVRRACRWPLDPPPDSVRTGPELPSDACTTCPSLSP